MLITKIIKLASKIFLVLSLSVSVYFGTILSINLFLDLYQREIPSLIKNETLSVDFAEIELTYSFTLKIDNLKVSTRFLEFTSDVCLASIDPRRLTLGLVPVDDVEFHNVVIKVTPTETINATSSNLSFDLNKVLKSIRNLKLSFNSLVVEFGEFKINLQGFVVRINKDASIMFNAETEVKIGSGKSIEIFHTTAEASGILQFNPDTSLSNLVSSLSLKDNDLFGVKLKDIDINISMQDGKIIGLALGEDYYGSLELSPSLLKLEMNLKDLSDEVLQYKPLDVSLKNLFPDIYEIVNSVLRNVRVSAEISQEFISVELMSENLSFFYKKGDVEQLSLIYSDKKRKIFANFLNSNLFLQLKNFSLLRTSMDLLLNAKLGNEIIIKSSHIHTPFVKGNLLDNLRLANNKLEINNDYLSGNIDLGKIKGELIINTNTLKSILKELLKRQELLGIELPSIAVTLESNAITVAGKSDDLDLKFSIAENTVNITCFHIKKVGLDLKGKIKVEEKFLEGNILIRYRSLEENLHISGSLDEIVLSFRKLGLVKVVTKDSQIDLSLRNIDIGNGLRIEKVYGILSNENIYLDCEIGYGELHAKTRIVGNLKKLSIVKGYVYTRARVVEFTGSIDLDEVAEGVLNFENSKIVFQFVSPKEFSFWANLDNFRLPMQSPIGMITKINGNLRARINLEEENLAKMVRDVYAELSISLEGIFNKINLSALQNDESLNLSIKCLNYFNIFTILAVLDNSRDVRISLLLKERLLKRGSDKELAKVIGKLEDIGFEGKLYVSIDGFSGLNERWEKSIHISSNVVRVDGGKNGINLYKDSEIIRFSYLRSGNVVYEFVGKASEDTILGSIRGKIPLDFLRIPDFLEKVEGILELQDAQVRISGGKVEIYGYSYLYGEFIKTALAEDTFSVPKARLEFQGNKIVGRNIRLLSKTKEIKVSGVVHIDSIDNPGLNINLSQTKGEINFTLNLGGGLAIEGRSSNAVLSIRGTALFPVLEGEVSFIEGARVEYFALQIPSPENEFWGFTFPQLAEWNLRLRFNKAQLTSEIIEGQIESAEILVRGNFSRKTLSLTGYANLTSGSMKYLGRHFTIDNLQLSFQGQEMDFTPFVNGTLYVYAYDDRNEENVKVIMNVSGKVRDLKVSFFSEPERTLPEISALLGMSGYFGEAVKQVTSLVETMGIYDLISYNIKKYTKLDVFVIRSPFVYTYLRSIMEGNYLFSSRDLIKGTEMRIGKSILPGFLVEYRLSLDAVGDEIMFTNVMLHSFLVGWSFYNFLLEFQYSSVVVENRVEFEPKLNIRYNKRF
ncbi:MAG: translocation/assembly module TamB domain-containing protein [Brevinematia bacterium]